jgi:predicted RNase H-like HicB family nuclease
MGDRSAEIELTARVHREDDTYWAEVVQLPGCFASGESLDELAEALSEAIRVYRSDPENAAVAGEERPIGPLEVGEMKLLIPA